MLTDKPAIVIAKAPSRIRRKAAAPARIVTDAKTEATTEDQHRKAGEAADRLWQEMVRAAGK